MEKGEWCKTTIFVAGNTPFGTVTPPITQVHYEFGRFPAKYFK